MTLAPIDAILLGFVALQMAVGFALAQRGGDLVHERALLAALLLTNALISMLAWVHPGGLVSEPVAAAITRAGEALDAATLWLVAGLIAAGTGRMRPSRAWRVALVGGGAVFLLVWGPNLLGVTLLGPREWDGWYGWYLDQRFHLVDAHRTLFTPVTGLLVVALSRGARWARWVALAFLPRVLHLAVAGLWTWHLPPYSSVYDAAGQITPALALALGLWGAARLLTRSDPAGEVVVPLALLGVAAGLLFSLAISWDHAQAATAALVINLSTLAVVRPLVVMVGVAPHLSIQVVARSVFATALGFAGAALLLAAIGTTSAPVGRLTSLVLLLATMATLSAALGVDRSGAVPQAGGHGPLAPGAIVLDRYWIEHRLGGGATGTVYAARDVVQRRAAVVKVLADGAGTSELAAREREAVRRLDHPNIVPLLDWGSSPAGHVLVFERIEGPSLADAARSGPVDLARVGHDLFAALEAVHAAGLVHRDVKPGNVLIDADGRARLTDFGVARVPDADRTLTMDAPEDPVVGTLRTMAPEQAQGSPASPSSDLYAAAATLYEVATGTPYVAVGANESAAQVRARVAGLGPYVPSDRLTPELNHFFSRALEPLARRRFASASQARAAWEDAVDRNA